MLDMPIQKLKRIIHEALACTVIAGVCSFAAYADEDVQVQSVETAEITMSKTSYGYKEEKGLWLDDSKAKTPDGRTTRYCYSAKAVLSYTPRIWSEGRYGVYYWNAGSSLNRGQQEFVINSKDGEAKVTLNLKSSNGWKCLGVYDFAAGTSGNVKLIRNAAKGGCVRSGMLKLIPTDKEKFVAYSQEAPITVHRYYPPGNGILVQYSFAGDDYKYEELDGGFGNIGVGDCTGRSIRYTYSKKAKMNYRPTIKEEKDYHVMYFSKQNGSVTNSALQLNVHYSGGVKRIVYNANLYEGWIYLGKYHFKAGTDGYLETINGENGEMLLGGGAYFVSDDDEDFDPSIYSTPDNPGKKDGTEETSEGEYLIAAGMKGYDEFGLAGQFNEDGFYLDCRNRYSHRSTAGGNGMVYSAKIKESGKYEVFYYVTDSTSCSATQKIAVGTDIMSVDCKNQSGWIMLGEYNFTSGETATVTAYVPSTGEPLYSGGVKIIKK